VKDLHSFALGIKCKGFLPYLGFPLKPSENHPENHQWPSTPPYNKVVEENLINEPIKVEYL
jgi:hypothetical protein